MSVKTPARSKVGCAGVVVEDIFCGPMQEMPPEGLLVSVDAMPTKAGGCAANVAIDLVKQGLVVEVAGCVGEDAAGTGLRACFAEHGIDAANLCTSTTLPTSRTVILLVEGEDRRYVHLFGANRGFTAAGIDRDWLASLGVFYLGGLFALPAIRLEELTDVFAHCRAHGVVTVLDVVIPSAGEVPSLAELRPLLELSDYFLPNEDEAARLTGTRDVDEQMAAFLRHGADTVIITRGEQGAVAGRADQRWSSGSYPEQGVDPSGAGDAFTSGVIASILAGREMPDLLRYAAAIGVSATRAVGTTDGVVGAAEAAAYVAAHPLAVEHL